MLNNMGIRRILAMALAMIMVLSVPMISFAEIVDNDSAQNVKQEAKQQKTIVVDTKDGEETKKIETSSPSDAKYEKEDEVASS